MEREKRDVKRDIEQRTCSEEKADKKVTQEGQNVEARNLVDESPVKHSMQGERK